MSTHNNDSTGFLAGDKYGQWLH